ncbi:Uncharacterised protein [Mycobacterium tuberculosis]|nr:Uncharacterised protein [Mycobacterium tuberculosis]
MPRVRRWGRLRRTESGRIRATRLAREVGALRGQFLGLSLRSRHRFFEAAAAVIVVVPIPAGSHQRTFGPKAKRREQTTADQRDQAGRGECNRQHPRPQRQPVALVASRVDLGFDRLFGGGDLVVGKRDLWFEWVTSEVVVGALFL